MSVTEYRIICSDADAQTILEQAARLDLRYMRDWPYSEPSPELWSSTAEITCDTYNVLFLIKPEWIFGPIIFNKIEIGSRSGTYSIQPRVDFACIEFYASGEKLENGWRRLSSASIVLRSKPIDSQTYLEMKEVDDCKFTFNKMVNNLKVNFLSARIEDEDYLISKAGVDLINGREALPPFPYQDIYFLK